MRYANHFSTLVTPQNERADSRQVQNSAGGFTFELTPQKRLERFLILGCEGGTYYASERKLTKENAGVVTAALNQDGAAAVEAIAALSESGRAPKNDPSIFALAIACGHSDPAVRRAAEAAVPRVCRTGTHLFQFVSAVENFRGWGRGLKKAVGGWYSSKTADELAYQVAKYQQREGWSHRDVLRKAHIDGLLADSGHRAVYRYVVSGAGGMGERTVARKTGATSHFSGQELPEYLEAFEKLKRATTPGEAMLLIGAYNFTHEMVPSALLKSPEVWEALLQRMPMTAMIRSLARMTAIGLVKPLSSAMGTIVERLGDAERLKKARVHPIQVLSALLTYRQGHGEKGSLSWEPVQQIVDALDGAFYSAFDAIEPTGKRTLLAIDVSGSMQSGVIAGVPGLTPQVGAAAMAMVTARVEKNYHVMAFGHQPRDLPISPRMRLDEVCRVLDGWDGGRTDCAQPMIYAGRNKLSVDVFQVYTDNETWAGHIHPHQALRVYRNGTGIASKLAVVGMTSTGFTIADPRDPGQLDFVGFDAAAPQVLAQFAADA